MKDEKITMVEIKRRNNKFEERKNARAHDKLTTEMMTNVEPKEIKVMLEICNVVWKKNN